MYPMDGLVIDIQVDEGVFMAEKDFENRFGSKEDHKFEYDYFANHDKTTPAWKLAFDKWKQQGILN